MRQHILIGITGGIAAYKVLGVIASLRRNGFAVPVIMTASAAQMIAPEEFARVSGNAVHTRLFTKNFDYHDTIRKQNVEHIQLADCADILVIAPATANVLAKLAHGIADDLLTTTALATTAPILLCPSMNVHMWQHPATQENIKLLETHGMHMVHPDSGALACGYKGVGRLADAKKITACIRELLEKRASLAGKSVVVTAGATREPIDDVRFITNPSSGKMGAALAQACFMAGAETTLLRAKTAVAPRYQIKQELFETSEQLYRLMKRYAQRADILFHTAAVSDFRPEKKLRGKINSDKPIHIALVPQRKLIDEIKKINPKIVVVAFKAVYQKSKKQMVQIGTQKLSDLIDAVVVNDIGRTEGGFGADTNEVVLVQRGKKPVILPLDAKNKIAQKILECIVF